MRYIKIHVVTAMTSRGRTAIYKDIKIGKFPKPIKIGNSSFWVEEEVLDWMKAQVAMRDKASNIPMPPYP